MKYKDIKENDILVNNQGIELKVLRIFKKKGLKAEVQFTKTGFIKTVQLHHLRDGKAKDPYAPTKFGVCCLGTPPKYAYEDYKRWENLVQRVFDEKNYPTYKDVTICDRWLCFEYFLEDLKKMTNYGKPNMHLDKDLKRKGTKEYSPENCQLIHNCENSSHGAFTGMWVATHGSSILKSKFSSELGELIGCSASNIRQSERSGGLVKGKWKISKQQQ